MTTKSKSSRKAANLLRRINSRPTTPASSTSAAARSMWLPTTHKRSSIRLARGGQFDVAREDVVDRGVAGPRGKPQVQRGVALADRCRGGRPRRTRPARRRDSPRSSFCLRPLSDSSPRSCRIGQTPFRAWTVQTAGHYRPRPPRTPRANAPAPPQKNWGAAPGTRLSVNARPLRGRPAPRPAAAPSPATASAAVFRAPPRSARSRLAAGRRRASPRCNRR